MLHIRWRVGVEHMWGKCWINAREKLLSFINYNATWERKSLVKEVQGYTVRSVRARTVTHFPLRWHQHTGFEIKAWLWGSGTDLAVYIHCSYCIAFNTQAPNFGGQMVMVITINIWCHILCCQLLFQVSDPQTSADTRCLPGSCSASLLLQGFGGLFTFCHVFSRNIWGV